jgi:hypothetical protein
MTQTKNRVFFIKCNCLARFQVDYFLDEENINRFLSLLKPLISFIIYLKEYNNKSIKRIIRVSQRYNIFQSTCAISDL